MGLETAALAGIALAGTAISAYGSYKEGQDMAAASRQNASVSRQNAAMIEQSGALDAARQRRQVASLTKKQQAIYGASGVTFSGSPLSVMIDSAAEGEMDARITEYNTKVNASQAMSQAAVEDTQAGIYERSGIYKAGSTLLTGIGSAGLNYYGYGYGKGKTTKVASGDSTIWKAGDRRA